MEIFSPIMVDLKGKLIDDRELVVPAIAFEQAFLFDELERLIREATRNGDDELVTAIDRVLRTVLPRTGVREP